MAKQTITALYDSRDHASTAALMLRRAGVPDADVIVSPETETYANLSDRPAKGFWASLESMFGGTDDHETYAEGLRRGGTLITAHVDDTKVADAVRILDEHGSVDMDERETTWRGEGWTGGSAITGGGVADTGAGPLRSLASAVAPSPVAAPVIGGASSARPGVVAARPSSALRAGADEVVQVVEESLSVGKRAVSRGKVRLHSYVVEKAVSEEITLRDETVSIDRRPVDRALKVGEIGPDAFEERTIEMEEIDEEAVVAKNVRVVEEIGIRKDAKDEVRTITDTVRSTKVDIDDGRTAGIPSGVAGSLPTGVAKDMEVVGSDGRHVGVVDRVDGVTIKLKRSDPASGGTHHLIPADWIRSVDTKVSLKTSAADVMRRWTAA